MWWNIMTNPELKECIQGKVHFQFYRKGELFYQCENGFTFTVPIDDTGDAAFNNKDKAILFMRWIRKALDERNDGQKAISG
jgi:hypothetical protein